ncbi:MAG: uracil-DNA glycosylase [Chloroflexota bacterium]
MTDRTEQMRQIRDEVIALEESPLYRFRKENDYYPVIGQGSHTARLMFIGEAPGENEAKTGRPFCGASGRVLDELLASIDLKREDVYITNVLKDRPPGNRDPQKDEIALYAPFLDRQIKIIQPQVIATLGRFAMEFILNRFDAAKNQKISSLHGQKIKAKAPYGEVYVVPLFHPAVALYRGDQKHILMEDFKVLKNIIS